MSVQWPIKHTSRKSRHGSRGVCVWAKEPSVMERRSGTMRTTFNINVYRYTICLLGSGYLRHWPTWQYGRILSLQFLLYSILSVSENKWASRYVSIIDTISYTVVRRHLISYISWVFVLTTHCFSYVFSLCLTAHHACRFMNQPVMSCREQLEGVPWEPGM